MVVIREFHEGSLKELKKITRTHESLRIADMPCHAFGRRAVGRLRHCFGDGAQVNLRQLKLRVSDDEAPIAIGIRSEFGSMAHTSEAICEEYAPVFTTWKRKEKSI
jgi:hypothetical protein